MSLSKTQSKRLASLLAVMSGETLPEPHLSEAVELGLVAKLYRGNISLTEKGLDEKNRLCTLAGLNIKYLSESKNNATTGSKMASQICGGNTGTENQEGKAGGSS